MKSVKIVHFVEKSLHSLEFGTKFENCKIKTEITN